MSRPAVPWFVWTSLASVSCILAGTYWDISWHMSIGRDSFWTPAHIAIQIGGITAGVSGAILVFATTFRKDAPLRDASVGVWGFRGPLGAFLGAWGAATMVVSAPFDNWWHNAYGLDVKILSPPHAVLTTGILAVAFAGVLLAIATTNRASGAARGRLSWFVLVLGGEILVLSMIAVLEETFRSNLHRAEAYRAVAVVVPLVLVTFGRATDQRWAGTMLATFYTVFMAAMVWLFPLFPAEPKLGPVYQHITHFIPLEFPLLLIVPAFAMDLLRARVTTLTRWQLAPLLGIVFVATFVAAEWPFATFMQSPAAENAFFGGDYFAYFMRPEWAIPRHEFFPSSAVASGLAIAAVVASITSWLGLVLGDALRKVKR
ncbi:MAG TPA: hypothetical protein VGL61_01900 [Kofleriaceae bacterium]|jgi:hypothetical protein